MVTTGTLSELEQFPAQPCSVRQSCTCSPQGSARAESVEQSTRAHTCRAVHARTVNCKTAKRSHGLHPSVRMHCQPAELPTPGYAGCVLGVIPSHACASHARCMASMRPAPRCYPDNDKPTQTHRVLAANKLHMAAPLTCYETYRAPLVHVSTHTQITAAPHARSPTSCTRRRTSMSLLFYKPIGP